MRITVGNGSRVEAICGELVSESANWIIRSDTLAIKFLIQQWRRTNGRVVRQYRTLCRLAHYEYINTDIDTIYT